VEIIQFRLYGNYNINLRRNSVQHTNVSCKAKTTPMILAVLDSLGANSGLIVGKLTLEQKLAGRVQGSDNVGEILNTMAKGK
jgi:hypothetical protein